MDTDMFFFEISCVACVVGIMFGWLFAIALWNAHDNWGTTKRIWSIVAIISAIIMFSCFAVGVLFGGISMNMDFWIDLFYKFKY